MNNRPHHDLNDVCSRLEKLIARADQALHVGNAILLAENHQLELLASIDKHLASIDEKTPPVSDEDIGVDGGGLDLSQKKET